MPDFFYHHEHAWAHARVAVGTYVWSTSDACRIANDGITHVINCTPVPTDRWYGGLGIVLLHHPLHDDMPPSADWLREGARWALRHLRAYPESKVLVHCVSGKSRSVALGYAILRALGMNALEAEAAMAKARPRMQREAICDAEAGVRAWADGAVDR